MTSANSPLPGDEPMQNIIPDQMNPSLVEAGMEKGRQGADAVEGSVGGLTLPSGFSTSRFFDPAFLAGIANDILREGRSLLEAEQEIPGGEMARDGACMAADMAQAGLDAIAGLSKVPQTPFGNRMDAPFNYQDPALFQGLAESITMPAPVMPGITGTSPAAPSFYFLDSALSAPVASRERARVSQRPFQVEAIRRDFPILNQRVHGQPLIWLDNAATTQKPRSVIDTINRFYERDNSNIHRGAHTLAARATDLYEGARQKVRKFLRASSVEEIVYVHGATEAINLVAQTYGRKFIQPGDEIIVSEIEHHANIVPWQQLAKEKGAVLKVIPANDRGELMLEEYERILGPKTRIVAVTQVSNSLGTVVPVKAITQAAHRHGAKVLVDGSQSIPHLAIDVQSIGCDFFVFSGHKLFAPTGIGVLYARKELLDIMPPWQGGGNMIDQVTFEETTYQPPPAKFEAGTGILAGAVGLGAAIDYLDSLGMENIHQYEKQLLAYGTEQLSRIPGLRLVGTAQEKASVLSFVLAGISTEDMGRYLDKHGIAVRAGHHCAQPSLRRFGLTSTVRPSVAFYNTFEELDHLAKAVSQARSYLS